MKPLPAVLATIIAFAVMAGIALVYLTAATTRGGRAPVRALVS